MHTTKLKFYSNNCFIRILDVKIVSLYTLAINSTIVWCRFSTRLWSCYMSGVCLSWVSTNSKQNLFVYLGGGLLSTQYGPKVWFLLLILVYARLYQFAPDWYLCYFLSQWVLFHSNNFASFTIGLLTVF